MEPLGGTTIPRVRWLGLLVGLLWLVHGLEKVIWVFAPAYDLPVPLRGGVGNVMNILTIFARDNPQLWFRTIVRDAMMPLGALNQYGATLLELSLAAVFLAGPRLWLRRPLFLYAATAGSFGMLGFIWMGFYNSEWPFTYLLIVFAALVVTLDVRSALERAGTAAAQDWGFLLRILLGLVWLFDGSVAGNPLQLVTGALLLAGFATPVATLAGLFLTVQAFLRGEWGGAWWWVYYFALGDHLNVLVTHSGRRYGLDRYLHERVTLPKWARVISPW